MKLLRTIRLDFTDKRRRLATLNQAIVRWVKRLLTVDPQNLVVGLPVRYLEAVT